MNQVTEPEKKVRKEHVYPANRKSKKPTPAIQNSIEIACKRLSRRALEVLERAMDESKTPNLEYRYRIQAAKEILDRAWGKPKQAVEANINIESNEAFLDALRNARLRVLDTDQVVH